MYESQQPVALGRKFYPGDLVVPINGKVLHCGTMPYPDAVVVSIDPFVLVSQSGDMVWSVTAKPEEFEAYGVASPTALINAFVRYLSDVRQQLSYSDMKWREYEREYIMPCFEEAKKRGFDLEQIVRDNPGRNCVRLLIDALHPL
jgi:hypothetical protein